MTVNALALIVCLLFEHVPSGLINCIGKSAYHMLDARGAHRLHAGVRAGTPVAARAHA